MNGRELSSECGYTIQGWPCHTQSRLDGEIIFEQNLEYWNTSLPTSIPRYDGIVLHADINGNSSYRLLAFVTDYLGSVRSVVDMPSGTVVEENDYYPLGLRIADPSLEESSLNRWRYNAKEDLSGIAGIPFSDYGARLADHFTGRWIAPDPMAEKYYAISPYVFCNNNSVIFADLDGELPQVIVGALGGAGVDIVSQMVVNAVSGNNIFDIDAKSVMISAIAGASGVGLANVVKKASAAYKLGKAATSAAKVGANALVDGTESVTKSLANGEEITVLNVATDIAIGAMSSEAGDMGRKAAESTKEFKVMTRQADRSNRVARGSSPESSKARKAADAQQKVQNYVENEGRKKEFRYRISLQTINGVVKKYME